MSDWSADGVGSSRERDRSKAKGFEDYRSRDSNIIDLSEYSKRSDNKSSSHRRENNDAKDRWNTRERGGERAIGSSSHINNNNNNAFRKGNHQQQYNSHNGPHNTFGGNGNGAVMMNDGYAGQYMGNVDWNEFPPNGHMPSFVPPGAFVPPTGYGMDMQGQYQGWPGWSGNDGSQFRAVDNGWGRKVRNGKARTKDVRKVKDDSEDEDSDARERRREERLKRRRRSAGLWSDSDESSKDKGRERDNGRKDMGNSKQMRDESQYGYKRNKSRDVSATIRMDRKEGEGNRRRGSPSREMYKRQRSTSGERHTSRYNGEGKYRRQIVQEEKKGEDRRQDRDGSSNQQSDAGYYRGRRDRELISDDEGGKGHRRNANDRKARERDRLRSSTSPIFASKSTSSSQRPYDHDRRQRDNGWSAKRSKDEGRRDGRYPSKDDRQIGDKSERRRASRSPERIEKKDSPIHNSEEKEERPATPKRQESKPSDAMQAAMEAALLEVAPDDNDDLEGREPSVNFVSEEKRPPQPIIRARPDEIYEQISQVGEGTYGQVYKAKGDKTGVIVALKKIRMESEKDGFPITAMREIKLLQGLRHENIVRLHEMLLSKNSVYMVFEYLQHDLNGILAQPLIQFEESHLKSLAQQLLLGLAYLHRHSILHRDLKGSNLLLNSEGTLKLADFGLARRYQKRSKSSVDYTNRVVTLWYRPPELLFGETCYNDAIDVWGAGCIFLELFTRKPVFQGNDEIHQVQVLFDMLGPIRKKDWPNVESLPWYDLVRPRSEESEDAVKEGEARGLRSLLVKRLPSDALDVAEALLRYDPSRRLSASQALKLAYFTRNAPRPEKPRAILSRVEGEWHEFESRHAKRMQPSTQQSSTLTSFTQQARTDSPHLLPAQKVEMGPPQSHLSPNINNRAAIEKRGIPA